MKTIVKEKQHLDADVTTKEGLEVLLLIQLPRSARNFMELVVDYQPMAFRQKKNAKYNAVSNQSLSKALGNHIQVFYSNHKIVEFCQIFICISSTYGFTTWYI